MKPTLRIRHSVSDDRREVFIVKEINKCIGQILWVDKFCQFMLLVSDERDLTNSSQIQSV